MCPAAEVWRGTGPRWLALTLLPDPAARSPPALPCLPAGRLRQEEAKCLEIDYATPQDVFWCAALCCPVLPFAAAEVARPCSCCAPAGRPPPQAEPAPLVHPHHTPAPPLPPSTAWPAGLIGSRARMAPPTAFTRATSCEQKQQPQQGGCGIRRMQQPVLPCLPATCAYALKQACIALPRAPPPPSSSRHPPASPVCLPAACRRLPASAPRPRTAACATGRPRPRMMWTTQWRRW